MQAAENLEIASQLPGHLPDVLPFELTNSVLLVCKALPGILQLAFEKLGSALRLLLTHLEVLVDEQVGQFAGHLLGDFGGKRGVGDIERADLIVPVTH